MFLQYKLEKITNTFRKEDFYASNNITENSSTNNIFGKIKNPSFMLKIFVLLAFMNQGVPNKYAVLSSEFKFEGLEKSTRKDNKHW